jgi:TolA-binding protein
MAAAATDIPKEIKKGRQYFKEGDHVNSKEQFEIFFHKAPPDSFYADEALLMIGVSNDWIAKKVDNGYFIKEERKVLSKLVSKYKESIYVPEAHLYLGQTYAGFVGVKLALVDLDYQKAIKHFETAYKKAKKNWIKQKALMRLGQTYQKMELKLRAKEYYLALLDLFPASESAKKGQRNIKRINPKDRRKSSKPYRDSKKAL